MSDILDCTRACVILHHVLVRMNQAGFFVADISMEEENVNIISKMFDGDADAANVGAHELEEVAAALEEEEAGVGEEELNSDDATPWT